MEGVVKWFDARIGYGFIVSPELVGDDGKPQDIFAHYTKIQMEGFKKLETGEVVSFDLVWAETAGGKQPQAVDIVRQVNPE